MSFWNNPIKAVTAPFTTKKPRREAPQQIVHHRSNSGSKFANNSLVDPQMLANEELTKKLNNRLLADQTALRLSNYPSYRGDVSSPVSPLTQRASELRTQFNQKPSPYSKKIETVLKREGKGFSPEQNNALLDMLGRGRLPEEQLTGRLQKQFGSNYGYEPERQTRISGKLQKDMGRSRENAAANLGKFNEELRELENQRNVEIAKKFQKAGLQKTNRRNAVIGQLEEYGNQEHALNNLKGKAIRDSFEEEYEAPYKKIITASNALRMLGPERKHPDKENLRNMELQRILNSYNTPYSPYGGQRVVDIQPETRQSFEEMKGINPKYRDMFHGERKGIEKGLLGTSLPGQVFEKVPGAMEPLMKNLDYLGGQQLKKASKEIAGKHVRLGTFGSGAHKAETEKNLREVLRRVQQEREGVLSSANKTEASLALKRDENALAKHQLMGLLGNQEFGNLLERNKQLNKQGWTKRGNLQEQENAAMRDWYRQLQHEEGGSAMGGHSQVPHEYETDLSSLFGRPQVYNEGGNYPAYQNYSRKLLGHKDLLRQIEDTEDNSRRYQAPQALNYFKALQPRTREQAFALARSPSFRGNPIAT